MNNIITLNDVLFGYEEGKDIFCGMDSAISEGVTSLTGQNGTGKSTFMLLAAGRLIPEKGTVNIFDRDTTTFTSEEELNKWVSIIYQNLEFETEDNVATLLNFVFEHGHHDKNNKELINKVITTLELKEALQKKTNETSKGEMQRVIIAFAVLFGSKIIMMDEPVFALEHYQKDQVFSFLREYSHEFGISIIFSIHELDISRKYSDNVLLFTKDKKIIRGTTEEVLTKENLEEAYQVPMDLLYERESLIREKLINPVKPGENSLDGKILEG